MPDLPPRRFPLSFDRATVIMSLAVCLLLAAVAAFTQSLLAGSFGAVLLLLAYAWSPRGYALSDGAIVVRRLAGNVRIPLSNVTMARVADEEELRGSIRLWGSGGLFGYYGLFHNSRLGRCTWYVTQRNKIVLVVAGRKTMLFSPDDAEGFLSAIHQLAPQSALNAAAPLERHPLGLRPVLIGIAGAAVVVAIVAFALTWNPGLPEVTITGDSLTIHDRFYPVTLQASETDIPHLRVVVAGADSPWRPTARTNGFANSHYRSGWFRVASGKSVRLYRGSGNRLVLIPPVGDTAPVLLETADPEGLIERIRLAWTR